MRALIKERLAAEQGTIYKYGKREIALVYPSSYAVGMSSLGFQTIYRLLNELPDTVAQRAFLEGEGPLLTYESLRLVRDFKVVAFSLAYELEIFGLLSCLAQMNLPVFRQERAALAEQHTPLVILGGPLTFTNYLPLSDFVDVLIIGEAEALLSQVMEIIFTGGSRAAVLKDLATLPGCYVPEFHQEIAAQQQAGAGGGAVATEAQLLPLLRAPLELLPAHAAIVTKQTVLADLFLLETIRGCPQSCTFCVMRRPTKTVDWAPPAGSKAPALRVLPVDELLRVLPPGIKRVGLVGAAVSEHPELLSLLTALRARELDFSLASLRADRLTSDLLQLLARGGNQTLTIGLDGASERLRKALHKGIKEEHVLAAADLALTHGFKQFKIYAMFGILDETLDDLQELATLGQRVAKQLGGRLTLSLALNPLVPKLRTPLGNAEFKPLADLKKRVLYLKKALPRPHSSLNINIASLRASFIEASLAKASAAAGKALWQVWQAGGDFAAFKQHFSLTE